PLAEGDSDSLTVIVDGSTVEGFADGGQVAMASRVYFEGGCSSITSTTDGDAQVLRDWYISHPSSLLTQRPPPPISPTRRLHDARPRLTASAHVWPNVSPARSLRHRAYRAPFAQ